MDFGMNCVFVRYVPVCLCLAVDDLRSKLKAAARNAA